MARARAGGTAAREGGAGPASPPRRRNRRTPRGAGRARRPRPHQVLHPGAPRHPAGAGHAHPYPHRRPRRRSADRGMTDMNETTGTRPGFWKRLTQGLTRTATELQTGITDLFTKRQLDASTIEEFEDVLIRADLGVENAAHIGEILRLGLFNRNISGEEVREAVAGEIEAILTPVARPLQFEAAGKPFVLLMVGVNGSGKTTTIGKLASTLKAQGKKVVLAAGDTFRAAATEQLKVWAERTGASLVARGPGADAAGVAYDGIEKARAEGADVLIVDTAGRLQNRAELMAELEKIVRVIKKQDPSAPHAVVLTLDATVGQNALAQVEAFQRVAGVTGLVMTKLDGTARGGILVAIAAKYRLPIHLIGVGEGIDDLQPFAARDFARAIVGLES
ncbi:signal recognition particle-docking protein FtsY [Starkeya koreensis]|uniref:Signal recognition particle receptor FtsY n=2 Tax=Ancylobacter koreensis TaxID=266121 RepID=A0ABT0DGN9_9HYPH|nr:signal recognition particle-docking protein FtsY [Ancylobacter koreensis]